MDRVLTDKEMDFLRSSMRLLGIGEKAIIDLKAGEVKEPEEVTSASTMDVFESKIDSLKELHKYNEVAATSGKLVGVAKETNLGNIDDLVHSLDEERGKQDSLTKSERIFNELLIALGNKITRYKEFAGDLNTTPANRWEKLRPQAIDKGDISATLVYDFDRLQDSVQEIRRGLLDSGVTSTFLSAKSIISSLKEI